MVTCSDINGVNDGSRTDVESVVAPIVGDVEVVKVNHHGSSYSSNATHINTLRPEVSIISVGKKSYGHPSPAVVTALVTEDGVYLMDGRHQGHPAIHAYINRSTEGLTFAERLDDGTCTDSGTCVFATRVEWNGNMYLTDLAVDVDGDLASQIDHVTWVDADE